MAVVQVSGRFGGALSVTFPDHASRQVGSVAEFMETNLTFGGMVKRHGTGVDEAAFHYVDLNPGGGTPFQVVISDDTPSAGFWRPEWSFQNGALTTQTITCAGVAQDTDWHHIAITYAIGGDVKYYFDGELVSTTGATLLNRTPAMSANSWIRLSTGDFYFDEWAVDNRILTATQIANWFSRGFNL